MHFLIVVALLANDPRAVLVGTWVGESICTNVRPACHDEHAVYHVVIRDGKPGIVSMIMNKLVDGKEIEMGTLDFNVNRDATVLTAEFRHNELHGLWSFTRTGLEMRGTLTVPPHEALIRNIHVAKK